MCVCFVCLEGEGGRFVSVSACPLASGRDGPFLLVLYPQTFLAWMAISAAEAATGISLPVIKVCKLTHCNKDWTMGKSLRYSFHVTSTLSNKWTTCACIYTPDQASVAAVFQLLEELGKELEELRRYKMEVETGTRSPQDSVSEAPGRYDELHGEIHRLKEVSVLVLL